MNFHSKHAEGVDKIGMVPRGRAALGYTLQLPETEQYLLSEAELFDKFKEMLGGRAAEEIVFNEITTGAENEPARPRGWGSVSIVSKKSTWRIQQ